ncbi:MAG TPA: hypothetical protein VFT59_03800, partial [Candidatus Saccharimonadales bacterium]|nr:hypothetical protein [Candidatus Saccharimonadales bacterium]
MRGLFSKKSSSLPARRQANTREDRRSEQATPDDLDQRYNFRRNRTLTGSSSSQVASVNEGNAQLKSPRVQAHELMKRRRRLGGLFGIALLSGLGIYLLLLQFTATAVVNTTGITASLD